MTESLAMPIVRIDPLWLVPFEFLAWLVIHLAAAFGFNRIPPEKFRPENAWFREKKWERHGRIYSGLFRVKKWKSLLPDGGAWLKGGFSKKTLHGRGRDREHLELFLRETCRAETVHWIVFASSLLFFLWSPWFVGLAMIAYAALANAPCIIAQRYNRIKIRDILAGFARTQTTGQGDPS